MSERQIKVPEASRLLDHVESLISLGERRASIYIALNLALIAASLRLDFDKISMFYIYVFWALASLGAMLSLFSLNPQSPHFQGKHLKSRRYTLQFFSIAKFRNEEEFIASFHGDESPTVTERILSAVYLRSRWAERKFQLLKFASFASLASLATMGLMVAESRSLL
jgi:hypothetical protein